ncbi:hypothetical protein Tco_1064673 [Tanacetum coccineum]
MYYPRFTKVIIYYFLTQDKTVSWRNKIGMHTSKDDYLINTLRFVFVKEKTQIYSAILPESLTSPEMKKTKAYKTYIGFATGATPPKKRVKRPTKKSTKAPARVVLTEEAHEEVRKKSLRDFHKTHPSGSGTVTKTALRNDEDDSNNDHDSSGKDSDQENDSDDDKTQSDNENKSDFEHETNENESGSESNQEENEKEIGDDNEEGEDEFVKTPSNDFDDEDETKMTDKAEGDEDEEMDYTTNIPTTEAEIVSPIDVPVYHEVPSGQTPTLLTVLISVVTKSSLVYTTNIPQSLQSFTPPPLLSTPTPPPTTKATNSQSALPNFASIFQFNNRVIALEKEVDELKKDPLHT